MTYNLLCSTRGGGRRVYSECPSGNVHLALSHACSSTSPRVMWHTNRTSTKHCDNPGCLTTQNACSSDCAFGDLDWTSTGMGGASEGGPSSLSCLCNVSSECSREDNERASFECSLEFHHLRCPIAEAPQTGHVGRLSGHSAWVFWWMVT